MRHAVLLAGALVAGVLSALLTEWVQKLGHAAAIALPGPVFRRLGFPAVVDASTAGMRDDLAVELDRPPRDPHGTAIPPKTNGID